MFVVKCPKCGQLSKAFLDQAGRRGICPRCGKRIRIAPQAEEPPPDEAEVVTRIESRGHGRAKLPDTSPPLWLTLALAVGTTWLLYRMGQEWFTRGALGGAWSIVLSCRWIGMVEIFLFSWGLFLLAFKLLFWLRQERALGWDALPKQFTGDAKVRAADVDLCLERVNELAGAGTRSIIRGRLRGILERLNLTTPSILLNRVRTALEHLRLTHNVQQVRGALTGQSAIDANLLDSSYTIIRFLVWVIPIIGFIGTVMGIGVAVSEFSEFIPKISDVEKAMDSLREGLGQVTAGLGTAFNTTLVALCLVAPLMLATSWLRKSEERLLAKIDQFTNHHLLGILDDSAERP